MYLLDGADVLDEVWFLKYWSFFHLTSYGIEIARVEITAFVINAGAWKCWKEIGDSWIRDFQMSALSISIAEQLVDFHGGQKVQVALQNIGCGRSGCENDQLTDIAKMRTTNFVILGNDRSCCHFGLDFFIPL